MANGFSIREPAFLNTDDTKFKLFLFYVMYKYIQFITLGILWLYIGTKYIETFLFWPYCWIKLVSIIIWWVFNYLNLVIFIVIYI